MSKKKENNVYEHVQQSELSDTGKQVNSSATSTKFNYLRTLQSSNSIPRFIPNTNVYLSPLEDMLCNVHINIILNIHLGRIQ